MQAGVRSDGSLFRTKIYLKLESIHVFVSNEVHNKVRKDNETDCDTEYSQETQGDTLRIISQLGDTLQLSIHQKNALPSVSLSTWLVPRSLTELCTICVLLIRLCSCRFEVHLKREDVDFIQLCTRSAQKGSLLPCTLTLSFYY